jgi:hypothetical protein
MKDGMIELDSDFGKEIGFTSDKFTGGFMGGSYLWRNGDRIIISFIESKNEGKGDLSRLFNSIEALGLRVAVPTPMLRMRAILKRKGFKPHGEYSEMGTVEMWEKEGRE